MKPNRDFTIFAQCLETCFRDMLDCVSKHPPRNKIKAAIYKYIPVSQSLLGHPGSLGYMFLNPEIAQNARDEGTVLTAPRTSIEVGVLSSPETETNQSAKMLGKIEQHLGVSVHTMFEDWLKNTRHRDNGIGSRMAFCASLAERATGFNGTPMPGVGRIPAGEWSPFFDAVDAQYFAEGAAKALRVLHPDATERDAGVEGGRICGRLETLEARSIVVICGDLEKYATDPDTMPDVIRAFGEAVTLEAADRPSAWFDSHPDIAPTKLNLDSFIVPDAATRHVA